MTSVRPTWANEIRAIHDTFDHSYSSSRPADEFAMREFCANHKRVERVVATYGLYANDARRRKVCTTVTEFWASLLPDLVERDFSVGEPGVRTCGNMTYIATGEGWLYLADVLDLGRRSVVGYAMDERTQYYMERRGRSPLSLEPPWK